MRLLAWLLVAFTILFLIVFLVAGRDWLCGEVQDGVLKTCEGVAA